MRERKKNLEKIANLQLRFLALPSHLTNKKISEDDWYDWFPYPPRAMLLQETSRSWLSHHALTSLLLPSPTGLIALVESKKESGQVNVSSIRAEQVSWWNETQKKQTQNKGDESKSWIRVLTNVDSPRDNNGQPSRSLLTLMIALHRVNTDGPTEDCSFWCQILLQSNACPT
jgi:hypothetical protein